MFKWIKSFFVRSERYDVYHPKERLIYYYWNGMKLVSADPIILYKKFMDVAPSLSVNIKVSESTSKDAGKAHEEAQENIRYIFDLPTFENGGLTRIEADGLLNHFLEYCYTLKKNSNRFTTSSTNSEDSKGSSEGNQPTDNLSPSGSVGNVDSTVKPELSPMGHP